MQFSIFHRPRSAGRLFAVVKRFREAREGATAVEFAMVSVPFLGLLFAIFETAFVFFVTEALESAVAEAARVVMTGQVFSKGYTTPVAFRNGIICPTATGTKNLLPSFITCSNLVVDIRTNGTSGSTGFASADLGKSSMLAAGFTPKFCPGSQGDVVILRVMYPMPVYLSVLTASNLGSVLKFTGGQTNYTDAGGSGGFKHMLIATAAFRNEPFGSQAIATGC